MQFTVPPELADRRLFHANIYRGTGYQSARGNNPEALQWISHFGDSSYLPTGDEPDVLLKQAWDDRDEDAFKARAKTLCEGAEKGQTFQWLTMRKGDVVCIHNKANEYTLGIFPSEPWEPGAMLWRNVGMLDVPPDFLGEKLHHMRALRRVDWLMTGQISSLSAETKTYNRGFFTSTCQKATEGRAPPVYEDLLRNATPLHAGALHPLGQQQPPPEPQPPQQPPTPPQPTPRQPTPPQ